MGRLGAVRRLAGFSVGALAAAFAPLLVVPAITSTFGAAGWASVAIGLSIGSAGATTVELGWGLNGPQRVARMSVRAARRALGLSMYARALALVPMIAVCFTVAYLLAPSHYLEAGLVAAAVVAPGLGPAWYLVGRGRPWVLLGVETLPRVAAAATAALLLTHGAPLVAYAGMLAVGTLVTLTATAVVVRPSMHLARLMPGRRVLRVVRAQLTLAGGRLASAAYIALPVTLVAMVNVDAAAVFAAVERVQRIVLAGLQVIPLTLQGWVGSATTSARRHTRGAKAFMVVAGVGAVAAVVHAVALPYVVRWLFSGVVTLPVWIAVASALVVLLTCVSRGLGGLWLVSLGAARMVARTGYVGMVVGIPAILVLGMLGAVGAVAAEVLAEAAVLVAQARELVTRRRTRTEMAHPQAVATLDARAV